MAQVPTAWISARLPSIHTRHVRCADKATSCLRADCPTNDRVIRGGSLTCEIAATTSSSLWLHTAKDFRHAHKKSSCAPRVSHHITQCGCSRHRAIEDVGYTRIRARSSSFLSAVTWPSRCACFGGSNISLSRMGHGSATLHLLTRQCMLTNIRISRKISSTPTFYGSLSHGRKLPSPHQTRVGSIQNCFNMVLAMWQLHLCMWIAPSETMATKSRSTWRSYGLIGGRFI